MSIRDTAGRFTKSAGMFPRCPICAKEHDPKIDPIKSLKGPALINVDPEILLFHGKETIEVSRGPYHSYNLRGCDKKYPPAPTPEPFLGIEVEVDQDPPHDNAARGKLADIWADLGLGFTKTDSSVSGIESVTFPHTFERLLTSNIEEALRQFKRAGAMAWKRRGPGQHLHLSRASFLSNYHLWRFCVVHEMNDAILKKLSGRVEEKSSWGLSHGCVQSCRKGSRDMAINLTNSQTVEMRFWQGTLQPVGTLGAAAVEDVIWAYTKAIKGSWNTNQTTDSKYQWGSMMDWAQEHRPDEHARILALTELRSGPSEE